MNDLEALLERFRRGPEVLAATLTGAAGPELDFKLDDSWSIRQIVAHVSDSELVAADRFRRIIAEDNPVLVGFDQDKWATALDYSVRKPSHGLEMFRNLRSETFDILKNLSADAYTRTGNHSERGVITLKDLLLSMAEHAEAHAQQIRKVREQYKASRTARA